MAFSGGNIPDGMSVSEYQDYCHLDQYFSGPLDDFPSRLKAPFLSKCEAKFLSFLKAAHPSSSVMTQVQLIRLVNVDVENLCASWRDQEGCDPETRPNIKRLIGDINLLSVDFVLLDASGCPYFVIELDGPEHQYDPNVLEAWVKIQAKKRLTSSEKKIRDQVAGWERDRLKESAIRCAGLAFKRIKNAESCMTEYQNQLNFEISEYSNRVVAGC